MIRRVLAISSLAIGSLLAQVPQLDCHQPADVQLSPDSPRANLRFQASAAESVYIRLTPTTVDNGFSFSSIAVADTYGNLIQARSRTQSVSGATPADMAGGLISGENYLGLEFDLPSDGAYTLQLVSGSFSASGSFHVTMTRLNRPCTANSTLSCGRSQFSNIPASSKGQVDSYRFNVQTGDVVSFRLLRVAASGSVDSSTIFFFAVYAADPNRNGYPYAVNMDSNRRVSYTSLNGAAYGRFDWTSTLTGAVNILVFEYTGGKGGSYYVSASKLNGGCGGSALTCNSAADGQISSPLSFGFYTLQASSGDVYQFRAARTGTSGTFAPSAEVYDSRGTKVGSLAAAVASGHAAANAVLTLPRSDTYSVLVSAPLDGSLGAYSVATVRLNRPCDAMQALTCSSVADGAVSGVLRSQVYSLTASANDSYLIRLLKPDPSALFRPRLDVYDATGASIAFLNTTGLARTNVTFPSDGAYTLVVTDSYDGSQSGGYAISTLRLNRPCAATALSCGSPAAGSLPRSLANVVYSYAAADRESFTARMLPGSGTPSPALEVYDASGNSVGQTISSNFTGVDVPAPAAGNYAIVATDSSSAPAPSTFSVDLLRTTNACAVAAAPQGATVSGVVSAASPFQAYRVTAKQGDALLLRASASTSGLAAQMELYGPDGLRLDSGVFSLSRKTVAGTYTVIVGAASPLTAGGYSFSWQLLNRPAALSSLACGGTTSSSLSASNQFRYYAIPATAGDILRLLFTRVADNFNPQFELFDPAGSRVTAASDVTHKTVKTGDYVALVSPSTTATETGAFAIAMQRPNNPCTPQPLTCGQGTLKQATVPAQLDTYSFAATGGDITSIRIAARSGAYTPFAELYSPSGALIAATSNSVLSRALPADGTYSLLIRDRNGLGLGSYRVSLQDDTNACSVTDTEAPTVTLIRPTGGEVLPGGTVYRVQWQSDDNVGVAAQTLSLSTDGGKTFADPFATLSGSVQTYDWMLPADLAPSRTAVLKLTAADAAGNSQSAVSALLTLIGSGFTPNASATYSYDGLNRLTQVTLDDGTTIQYTWDAIGNLVSVSVKSQ